MKNGNRVATCPVGRSGKRKVPGTHLGFEVNPRMKILLFYFSELGGLGGVDVLVSTLAGQMNQAGHPTGIIEIAKHFKRRRNLPDSTAVWGITVPSHPTIRRPRSWASFARAATQFLKVAHEFDADIVNVHFPLSQCLPVVGAHTLPHKWRLVVTVHNSDIRVAPFQEPGIRRWQARLFARADAVTAVNQALLDDATSLFPVIKDKGRVILNGVSSQWFQSLESSNNSQDYLLFAGRLSSVKGPDLLLEAWSTIHHSYPKTGLWMAGDGEERNNLEALAKRLGIEGSVRFLGRKNQEELCQLYRHAQGVILPSRREGLPLTLLEAGAAGAICVGSRTPGIPEIIQDGVTGFLVDTESVADLSTGIKKVLALSSTERGRMKHAAQTTIHKRFSEPRMISDYLELFQSLILN